MAEEKELELAIDTNDTVDLIGVETEEMLSGDYSGIEEIYLDNFMSFENIKFKPVDGINVIHGENSTGKSALLKAIYVQLKAMGISGNQSAGLTKAKLESYLVGKIKGVYRPDDGEIGRLVKKDSDKKQCIVGIKLKNDEQMECSFGSQAREHIDILKYPDKRISNEVVYIPPKEIISASENFESLYREYHIAFEETYVDLIRQLDKPEKKEIDNTSLLNVLDSLNEIVGGSIVQKGKKFYVKSEIGDSVEMGLLSEGYRKIATLIQLIKNGTIRKGTILIWDEPETNMNPKMIKPLVDALIVVEKLGVCIIIATHDYFVQQEVQMNAAANDVKTQFVSLYRDEFGLQLESKERAYMLDHNSIMEEFDAMYDREQRLMDDGKYD